MSLDPFYQAQLTCRRCEAIRFVCRLSHQFAYWTCTGRDGWRCGAMNVWRP